MNGKPASTEPETPDVVSDPAHSDDTGHDWSTEGGATDAGPATDTDSGEPYDAATDGSADPEQ